MQRDNLLRRLKKCSNLILISRYGLCSIFSVFFMIRNEMVEQILSKNKRQRGCNYFVTPLCFTEVCACVPSI